MHVDSRQGSHGRGLPLSAQDKQDIIAFLNTLTDYKFLADRRFADPNK